MLYFAAATLAVDGGIMVTGSHNPPDHNGFKLVLGGKPFYAEAIQELGRIAAALGDPTRRRGQIVEQLGMRRRLAAQAKIARRADQPGAEMLCPYTVDQHAGRQRIVGRHDSLGQLQSTAAVAKRLSI